MSSSSIIEDQDVVAEKLEAERRECEWLLTSGALGRSGNLTRILRFVCDEYFEGRADQIKEYTIAVEALGRRPNFNPQTDTIVRVTVHALRKRLVELYHNEGAGRRVHLVLPPGHYAPFFLHQIAEESTSPIPEEDARPAEITVDDLLDVPLPEVPVPKSSVPKSIFNLIGVSLAVAVLFATWGWSRTVRKAHPIEAAIVSSGLPVPAPQGSIHNLMGKDRPEYTDHSGIRWTDGNYCRTGTSLNLPAQRIEGTEDGPIYLSGVRGIVHCAFPVLQGIYELRLHFADTFVPGPNDPPMSTRDASISTNSGPYQELKVVDEAGGHNTALVTLVTGVKPENDGAIHLDYVSEVSPLNAIEILPAPSIKQLPIRVVSSAKGFVDKENQIWLSDRYFSGGRHGQQLKLANMSEPGIFQSSRVGRFRYNFPAVPLAHYRVKLYFRDPWFGTDNGGPGGPGSRVFDVACNGKLILEHFDILAEGDSRPVVKTFDHVQASVAGRIELYFMPAVNYAAVSAIEILPED